MAPSRLAVLVSVAVLLPACGGDRFELSSDAGAAGAGGGVASACHALQFDGVDDWVSVPDASELDALTPMTVEAWIKADSFPTEVQIVSHHDHGAKTGWVLLIFQSGQMQFRYQFGGATNSAGGVPVSAGQWHHVAVTLDSGLVRLFLDGVLTQKSQIPNQVAEDYSGPLAIGRSAYSDEFHFLGAIDNVRLSKVARYSASFTPPHTFSSDDDTVALWEFEGSEQIVADATGQHDGTLGADASSGSDDPERVGVPCTH
jgi:hypothetical protein